MSDQNQATKQSTGSNSELIEQLGVCKDCTHWTGDEADGFRICEQPLAYIGYQKGPKDMPPNGLVIEGDEGWGWYTGPEFGCVNFKRTNNP